MSLHDASFWFLERLEKDGEMTVPNVREFLRDIKHYSQKSFGGHCARSQALKYAAQAFLAVAEENPTKPYHASNLSWSAGWLRALAELYADEWFHMFQDVHPNMHPPLTMRQQQWEPYTRRAFGEPGPSIKQAGTHDG
jgi:hypothetical protein